MNFPKGFYLSYSKVWLYNNNPEEYYLRYVLGHKMPATPQMQLGSIVHKALAQPAYPWKRELQAAGFLSETERAVAVAIGATPTAPRLEEEFTLTWKGITIFGILDATGPGYFRERKVSAPGSWNEQRVADDLQISFYWWALTKLGRKVRKAHLDHINSKTGRVQTFTTTRKKNDLDGIENLITYVHSELKANEWDKPRK